MPPFLTGLLANRKALTGLGAALALLLVAVVLYGKFNSAQTTMVDKEARLGAQYSDCQNNLSSYVTQIKEALGVADRATEALDEVLTSVVKGRYEVGSTARPSDGSAFSAMVEAYPDLSNITVNYQRVQTAIFAGRDGFKNCQTRMLDLIRDYKSWKDSGLIASKINAMVGAPSDNLEARLGDDVVYGKSALERMQRLVLAEDATTSYETGIDNGIDTNPADARPGSGGEPTATP